MKILLFCAKGFETIEFSVFVDVLGWAREDFGYDVELTTCGFEKTVISTFGIPVTMDQTFAGINADDYDALAIPGGYEEYGFYDEAYDERFLDLIRAFDKQNKIIASICVGALPLGKSGVLKGRRGTTYHLGDGSRQKQLKDFGVRVVNEPIVTDNNIITSYCPETAVGVAFELLRKLSGDEAVDTVKKAMGY